MSPLGSICGSLQGEAISRLSWEGSKSWLCEQFTLHEGNRMDVTLRKKHLLYPAVGNVRMKDTFSISWMRWTSWLRLYAPLQKCEDLSSKSGDAGSRTRFLFHPQYSFKNIRKQSNLCWLGLCCICTFTITFQDDFSSPSFFVLSYSHFLFHLLPDPFHTCFTQVVPVLGTT